MNLDLLTLRTCLKLLSDLNLVFLSFLRWNLLLWFLTLWILVRFLKILLFIWWILSYLEIIKVIVLKFSFVISWAFNQRAGIFPHWFQILLFWFFCWCHWALLSIYALHHFFNNFRTSDFYLSFHTSLRSLFWCSFVLLLLVFRFDKLNFEFDQFLNIWLTFTCFDQALSFRIFSEEQLWLCLCKYIQVVCQLVKRRLSWYQKV